MFRKKKTVTPCFITSFCFTISAASKPTKLEEERSYILQRYMRYNILCSLNQEAGSENAPLNAVGRVSFFYLKLVYI